MEWADGRVLGIVALWFGLLVIGVYAGLKGIILLARVSKDYHERISGWGGLVYLIGLVGGKSSHEPIPDLWTWLVLVWGLVLLLFPKIYGVTKNLREH